MPAQTAARWRHRLNKTLTASIGYQLTKARAAQTQVLPKAVSVSIVVATQLGRAEFDEQTLLGVSVAAIPKSFRPKLTVFADNTGPAARGLPALYNQALDAARDSEILIFVHDDVHLHDWYIAARAREAMTHFDVAGIAGAVRSNPDDPSWYFTFDADLHRGPKQPDANLSGSVNHGDRQRPKVQVFGAAPAACELLDGVLLIVHAGRARAAGVRFDERFRFHLYDLDFCRSARQAGLRIGTWPISISHGSRGAWGSSAFDSAARDYLAKWPR